MIALLKGILVYRSDPYIVLDVHGVGYKVYASGEVLANLTEIGKEYSINTYTLVREDALELFGFMSPEDLTLFEQLIGVSGVGPKTAITIFSVGRRGDILNAIASGNVAFFQTQ